MEQMQVFGDQSHLVGWYNEPTDRRWKKTAVVMITPGMLHHVGPMRMHVQLARRLEKIGMASFRFNLSGIGESLTVASSGQSLDRASTEIRSSLDWLMEKHGHQQFILFGLCSGADDALAMSVNDERVAGLSLLDGCGFRTIRFYPSFARLKWMPKLFRVSKWTSAFRSLVMGREEVSTSMPLGQDIREFSSAVECQNQVLRLLKRGVRMQWIYTGGAIDYYSYQEQFFHMFPKIEANPQLSIFHLPQVDHLASMKLDRTQVLDLVIDWCATFPCQDLGSIAGLQEESHASELAPV